MKHTLLKAAAPALILGGFALSGQAFALSPVPIDRAATIAVPVKGAAVAAWMCEAVVPVVRPKKLTCTRMVLSTSSIVTIAFPVPGETLGGDSFGPLRFAV